MLTLLLLLSSEAKAVPLDLCANRGAGSLVGLGGQYLWEVDGNPDLLEPLWWSTLCGVGGNAAPVPTLLQPADGTVIHGGSLAEIAVAADAGDPEHAWGRCEWWAERDGEAYPLAVRLPGGTTARTSLPFSRTNPVCAGVAMVGLLPPGTYQLFVKASDLFGSYGEDAAGVRVNRVPDLLLQEPLAHAVYLTGDTFTATVLVEDDTPADAGSLVTFVVNGSDGSTTTPCTLETAGTCTATLTAPGAAGTFDLYAFYTDVDATTGAVASPNFYANDVPGVVITAPTDGEMIEPSVPTEIVVQVNDATASVGDLVDVTFTDGISAWTSTCGLDGALSCGVAFEPGSVGEYTLSASYTDAYGEIGVSPDVAVLANDTPSLTVEGLADGLVLEPGSVSGIAVAVTDDAPASGVLTAEVSDSLGTSTFPLDPPAADGSATVSLDFPDIDTYTVRFTFTDQWGSATSTAPMVVTTNFAPTLTLVSPASGERITLPSNDPTYETYHYTFLAWDDDDSALTVQPAAGLDAFAACTCDPTGLGAWECDLDVSTWALGVHTITVVAADDAEEATDTFEIELLSDTDYDYDGDGVLESDWLTYGDGYGDCAPEDPTTHGAAPDVGIAAAAELCDTVDNDCDGVVNDGLPDPEGGETRATATEIGGGSLSPSSPLEAEGSLYGETDIDWWHFSVPADDSSRNNASFSVTLTVPADSAGEPAGDWNLQVVSERLSGDLANYSGGTPTTDCAAAAATSSCTLSWSVDSNSFLTNELDWFLGVGSTVWSPEMCVETESESTYVLEVAD